VVGGTPGGGGARLLCPSPTPCCLLLPSPRLPAKGERHIKTGARLVRHGRYAIFQMAEVALPRQVLARILGLINGLRDPPAATGCT
jgi:hypothetical protein